MADYVTLNNGNKIPQVALGTSRIANDKFRSTIKAALDIGYRHIDTAFIYGNEVDIGQVLEEQFRDTGLKREDVFITTKLHNPYMEEGEVGPALDESLRRLNLQYIDLFLIHCPCSTKNPCCYPEKPPIYMEYSMVDLRLTWKAMEETVYQGKATSIGVSNFNSKQLEYICEGARITPAVIQVETHARFPQTKLQEFCDSRKIRLEAFSPLGSPYFTGSLTFNTVQSSDNLVEHPVVVDLARKYSRTTGQILLRNLVQRGVVVIPKSESPKRLKENLEIFNFSLSEIDMKTMSLLDNGIRRFLFPWYSDHPEYPFHAEF